MGKQTSVNLDITDNADGFDVSGGNTSRRKLTVTGNDITVTGSGSGTMTFPASAQTLVGRTSVDDMTNKRVTCAAGDTGTAPLVIVTGTNLTSLVQGAIENDGTQLYFSSVSTTNGRNKIHYGDNVRITSNFTATSLTAVDVTNLALAIPASQTWSFDFYMNGAGTAAGMKLAVTVPSGATLEAQAWAATTGVTVTRVERITTSGTLTTMIPLSNSGFDGPMLIHGICVNSSTAGNIQVQAAKVTSGTLTIYANSYGMARRIS